MTEATRRPRHRVHAHGGRWARPRSCTRSGCPSTALLEPGPQRRRAARRRVGRRARDRRGRAGGAARHDERRDRRDPRDALGVRRPAAPVRPAGRRERDLLPRRARRRRVRSALRPAARPVLDGGVGDLTGGIGPWLPFQMLALAWMGGMAGLVGPVDRAPARRARRSSCSPRTDGSGDSCTAAIMNLWFWPFARGGALDWQPGLGLSATLDRYWSFYVATSLGVGRRRRDHERASSSSSPASRSCAPSAASPTASNPPSSSSTTSNRRHQPL